MPAREALIIGTQGGAKVLGRDDIGRIAPGMAADFVAWRTDGLSFSGAQHDLVAALLFCTPGLDPVDLSVINGEVVVRDGKILTCDMKVRGCSSCPLLHMCICCCMSIAAGLFSQHVKHVIQFVTFAGIMPYALHLLQHCKLSKCSLSVNS